MDAAGLGTTAPMEIEHDFSGEGRLDSQGKLTVEVPTNRAPVERSLTVTATVSELALRPREA